MIPHRSERHTCQAGTDSLPKKLVPLLLAILLFAALLPAVASAQGAKPQATVVATKLNVRSGPGTTYTILASAAKNDLLAVLGKSNSACDWLKIKTKKGQEGWVAGTSQYVKLNVACSAIAVAKAPAPAPKPAATAAPKAIPPAPTATPTAAEPGLPPDMGCYLLQNQIGAELNWTFSGNNRYHDTFKMMPMEERVYCLYPGHYDVTVDAPPPWNSINFSMDVAAGDLDIIPIRAQ